MAEGVMVLNLLARQSGHGFLAAVLQSEILSLTNAERAQNNVRLLAENPLLDASAQAKAADMAAKGYFAHKSPDGTTPWEWIKEAGYDYQYAGDNLAVRFVDSKDVMVAWMASPTHRANVVKGIYTEIGIGIAQGTYKGEPATFVVQHFGKSFARVAQAPEPAPLAQAGGGAPEEIAVLGAEAEGSGVALGAPEAPAAISAGEPAPPVVAPGAAFDDSLARQLSRVLTEPRAATGWVLSGVAALLLLALAFAFFHRLQVQAHDLLLPGAVVAGIALSLIALNGRFLLEPQEPGQAAGVVLYDSGVVVTVEAASDER